MTERDGERRSFNPHWIGDELCRDYQIGNVVIEDVPDSYAIAQTKFRGGYGFAQGNVDEFLAGPIRVSFIEAHEARVQKERAERAEEAAYDMAFEAGTWQGKSIALEGELENAQRAKDAWENAAWKFIRHITDDDGPGCDGCPLHVIAEDRCGGDMTHRHCEDRLLAWAGQAQGEAGKG